MCSLSGEGIPNIGYWTDSEAWVEWSFAMDRPRRYEIRAELAVQEENCRFRVGLSDQLEPVERSLGQVRVEKAGKYTLRIKPDRGEWQPINVWKLVLKPSWPSTSE